MALTTKKRRLFLDELAKGYSESKAATAAGETLRYFQRRADEDPNFKKDWDDAIKKGDDRLEDVATRRAIKGSDFLLQNQLKARKPEKYRERTAIEHSGSIDLSAERASLARKLDAAEEAEEG